MLGGIEETPKLLSSSGEESPSYALEQVVEPKADPATKSQPQPSPDPKTKPVPDPISVSSSSDWDTLITLLAIFRGIFRVEQGVVGDVLVVGGTYEGSFSASVSSSISLKVGVKDFELPLLM